MNKKINRLANPILLSALLGLTLSACNSGVAPSSHQSSQPQAAKLKGNDTNLQGVALGSPAINQSAPGTSGGIVVLSNTQYLSTAESGISDARIAYAQLKASQGYTKDITTSEVLSKLGIDGSLKGSYKDLSGDFAANYLDQVQTSSTEITLTYSNSASALVELLPTFDLDSSYKDLSVDDIGDSYVTKARAGIYATATVKIKFGTESLKNNITASGQINFNSLNELAGSLQKLDEKQKSKISVEVELIQRGGDVGRIFSAFESQVTDNDGKITNEQQTGNSMLMLSSIGLDNCGQVIDYMQKYITNDFNNQIKTYLTGPTESQPVLKTVNDLQNLYLVAQDLSLKRYQSKPVPYKFDQEYIKLIDQHNAEFTQLMYDRNVYNDVYKVISPYLVTGGDSKPPAAWSNVDDTIDDLARATNSMVSTAKSCYSGIGTEPEIAICTTHLKDDIDNANKIESSLRNSDWHSGNVISSSTSGTPLAYLMPISTSLTEDTYLVRATSESSPYVPGTQYTITHSADSDIATINVSLIPEDYPVGLQSFAKFLKTDQLTKAGYKYAMGSTIYLDHAEFEDWNGELIKGRVTLPSLKWTSFVNVK